MTPEQQTPASVVEWKDEVVAEHLAHLRRKGDDASCMVIEYQAALIERLSAEREGLRAKLERLASSEAFDIPQVIDGPLAEELRQRLDYARAALTQGESRQTGWQDIATGDPLAWHIRRRAEDAGFGRPQVFTTDDASEGDLRQWRRNGYEVTPLYALPAAPTPADGGGE